MFPELPSFSADEAFLFEYATETFGAFVADVLRTVRHNDRRISLGSEVVTEQTFEDRSKSFHERFVKWKENAGSGKFVSLLGMTKPELLHAAEKRESMGVENLRRAALCRNLAQRLKGQSEVVADRWSAEEVQDLYERLHVPGISIEKAG